MDGQEVEEDEEPVGALNGIVTTVGYNSVVFYQTTLLFGKKHLPNW
ncbi:MAG: hypothetical protein WEC59_00175 [Salibacteraceae bacterium]